MIPSSFNRVVTDSSALRHNFEYLKRRAQGSDLLAMVKGDGYGHGMVDCSKVLEDAGCSVFGVAELREAVILRNSGVSGEILAMIGFEEEDGDLFFEYNITPVIYDIPSLQVLAHCAEKRKRDILFHLKVDTGMSRLGVGVNEFDTIMAYISSRPRLKLAGLASHFACSDNIESSCTPLSLDRFTYFHTRVQGGRRVRHHIANSGGTLYFPKSHHDMVRCGISLYGYYPDGRTKDEVSELKPVMSFTTQVIQVKEVEAGTGISYGHTYVTDKKATLAVLPVGYEDGFSRQLSNCGEVLIRGRRAPVRGRVCMNLCMVDVTGIQGVAKGDTVVILGEQGAESITADEIAGKIGSISYEVLCMIGNNNQRAII